MQISHSCLAMSWLNQMVMNLNDEPVITAINSPMGFQFSGLLQPKYVLSHLLLQPNFVLRMQLGSSSTADLPPRAISVEGGSVGTITPVAGSDGRLFNVGINSDSGARDVIIRTATGVTLASGLALAQSNTITVEVDRGFPQVSGSCNVHRAVA